MDTLDSGALANLDLSSNNIGGDRFFKRTDGVAALSGALKTNRSIKELNLASNFINAEAARIFSQDIQDNGALAKLDLSGNNQGYNSHEKSPDFIRPIGSMLKTNRSIKEIAVGWYTEIAGEDGSISTTRGGHSELGSDLNVLASANHL